MATTPIAASSIVTSTLSSAAASSSVPVIVVTELCIEKAASIAPLPYETTDNISGVALLLTTLLGLCMTIGPVVVAIYVRSGACHPRVLTVCFYIATVCLPVIAISLTTLVLAILHQYYCVENADLEEFRDACVSYGVIVSPWVLMALLNWLFLATNMVTEKKLGRRVETPWCIFIAAPPTLAVLLLNSVTTDLIRGVRYMVLGGFGRSKPNYSSLTRNLFEHSRQNMNEGVMWLRGCELLELGGWKSWGAQHAEGGEEMDRLSLDQLEYASDPRVITVSPSQSGSQGARGGYNPLQDRPNDSMEV